MTSRSTTGGHRRRRLALASTIAGVLLATGSAVALVNLRPASHETDQAGSLDGGTSRLDDPDVSQPEGQVPPEVSGSAAPSASAGSSTDPDQQGGPTPPTSNGPVIHGKNISASNTGYLAWRGPNGERCTDQSMRVYSNKVTASELGDQTCVWLKGGIATPLDRAITLTAARIDAEISNYGQRLTLKWTTVDATSRDYAVGGRVDCLRCQLVDASDGVRFDGTNIVETYIRLRQQSSADHNDGIQAYRASTGGSILRSNISSRPLNAPRVLGNAAIFIADDSRGEVVIRDNWLAGGVYTLRMHESATYRVTGNIITDYDSNPVSTDNAVAGAFLEWADNRTGSGTLINR